MLYKLLFYLKCGINLALLPSQHIPLVLGAFLLYLLMLRHQSFSAADSQHFTDNQIPKEHCEICNKLMFYRMRHCPRCEHCIHKYDHHCFLLEVCVGEFNHKYYICFLPVFTAGEVAVMWASLLRLPAEVHPIGGGIDRLSALFYLLAFEVFFSIAAAILCLSLFIKHAKLIVNNETTWERARRENISYMKSFPESVQYPFSEGRWENTKRVFLAD